MLGRHDMTACREPRAAVLAIFRDGFLALPTPPASPGPPRCDAALVRFVGDDEDLAARYDPDDDEPGPDDAQPPVKRVTVATALLEIAEWGLRELLASRRARRSARRELPCIRST
jgi:hypothetical protein